MDARQNVIARFLGVKWKNGKRFYAFERVVADEDMPQTSEASEVRRPEVPVLPVAQGDSATDKT